MPRVARTVAEGYPHHVTQRGNYRQTVFKSDNDYNQYLQWLKHYSQKYELRIWAYCLMKNHVHFVCVPEKEYSLAKTFNMLHMRYAQNINRRRKRSGHLWQGRFYSSILDERHTYAAVRYVENNPVRAGLVKKAEEYPYSSAAAHVSGQSDGIIDMVCYLVEETGNWGKYLREKEDEGTISSIRKNTMTGRPSGAEGFIKKLENKFGRRLRALSHGRPAKSTIK